jgi:predicted enzyme related to lactoylglutathione lyase
VLAAFPLNPILPASDGSRAEAFYRDVLGLQQLSPPGADPMAFAAGNGTMIVLSELRDRQPPPYPVVAFLVEGIEALVRELSSRGAEFLAPDADSFAGVQGVRDGQVIDFGAVRSTWLRDSEGNLLALNQLAG